jgi:hypothetical protein
VTLLVGDPNFTGYTGAGPTSTDGGYLAQSPFVASATGVISTLNAWLTPGSATTFAMGLYDGVLQRLAVSASITATPGLNAFPLSAPVVAGRAYQLLLAPTSAGTFQFGVDSTQAATAFKVANGGSLPQQLSGPTATAYGAPAFYVDGDSQAQVLTTTGTNQNLLNTDRIITLAFRRCRVPTVKISDELVQFAKDELYLLLVGLANGPTPLWAIETDLYPFTQGFAAVPLQFSTVDVKNVNYRQMSLLQSGPATYAPTTATQVTTLSITWSGPALPFQVFMQGQLLLTVSAPDAVAGQTTLYDLDGAIPATQWSVVGSNLGTVGFYNALYEIPMYAYSRDEWSQLPNRSFPGTPRQFWFERVLTPTIHLWPVPELADQQGGALVVFRHRHIQDVGALTNRIECPPQWLPAIVDSLAESLSRHPEVDPQLLPTNATYATASMARAKGDNRENAPTKIIPWIIGYTR